MTHQPPRYVPKQGIEIRLDEIDSIIDDLIDAKNALTGLAPSTGYLEIPAIIDRLLSETGSRAEQLNARINDIPQQKDH